MGPSTNYITNLPDFIVIQRTSFCWFIAKGLQQELRFFSKFYDFSGTTEYILFGEEYRLTKPSCTFEMTRKQNGSYLAQLSLPIEIRNKELNLTIYHKKFPLVILPLMSTYGTFILNGCERVIVSQIVRSPGIYFEKNKRQKKPNLFKKRLSTDLLKLGEFFPSGETSFIDSKLFFSTPVRKFDPITGDREKEIRPIWRQTSLNLYSINLIKQNKTKILFSFLQFFKFYRLLVYQTTYSRKLKLVQFFFKWLKKFSTILDLQKNFKIVIYFNILLRFIIEYQFLSQIKKKNLKFFFKTYTSKFLINSLEYHKNKELLVKYEKLILTSQIKIQIELNKNFLFIIRHPINWSIQYENFTFLKHSIKILKDKKRKLISKKFNPIIHCSKNLKDKFRYIFNARNKKEELLYFPERHKYLKSKTRLLTFQKDYPIKTSYNIEYDEKTLYTAILVPEYGSWIRFGFQKDTKINVYKYPLKQQSENIFIQLDKINQKPIISFLKEMGLNNREISKNLEHSNFFYITNPLIINSHKLNQPILRIYLKKNMFKEKHVSEFANIFNPFYYRLGKIGRLQLNTKLNIHINKNVQTITYEDIFAIIDKLLTLTISHNLPDDIDHLKNRKVRSIGELLKNLFTIGLQKLSRKIENRVDTMDSMYNFNFNIMDATVQEFFGSSQLSQYLDQTNPLSSLTHRRRISGFGPGGFDKDRVSFAVRDIHPSHYGRICPIETPEGKNVGLVSSLTTYARVNKSGFLETPFWRVFNGKILKTKHPIYLTADIEDSYKIAPADIPTNQDNYLIKNSISVRYNQDFLSVGPNDVDFISISTIQMVSIATSLIPFFEHNDANRALMGSNMQRQAVPLLLPQKPIVGTGLENQIANDSGMSLNAEESGQVELVTADQIVIKNSIGQTFHYKLEKYLRSNQQTCINYRPIVWEGEKVISGQMLTDGPSMITGEIALGQNILISYMPWQGYNFEDAILINERLVYDDILTSIHIERHKIEIDQASELPEQITKNIPDVDFSELKNLNIDGIIRIGTFVKPGDILVGKIVVDDNIFIEQLPEIRLLRAIFGEKSRGIRNTSYRMKKGSYGRVIDTFVLNKRTKSSYKVEKIYIFIAQFRKIQIGDKLAGRHGNKGIISRILPRQDMPFLPDGTPIDIVLNPLGVPSRMNVGQIYECLLGLAGDKLNCRFKILPFDEMYGPEMSRILVTKKLREASIVNDKGWLFNPYAPGKMVLIDGRTGKEFENPITVGNAYMLKLIHLVEEKIHSRATGPYSLITQQPLRGKAQKGGQRFGEMEVWALEGFGAAFTLKELLTIKSDDMDGRTETLSSLVKGNPISKFGIPESFKVLVQELRSIGLDISTYKIEKFSSNKDYESELNILENYNASSKTFYPTSNTKNIKF